MLDSYKMVVVNILASLVLVFFLIIYKFLLKKKINLLVLLILVSLLPLISMLRFGTYESGDLSLHALRSILYFKQLILEGTFPRWTAEFNSFYGDPHFLFAYVFHYFAASILHLLGLSFIDSLKVLLAISFVTSGVGMFYWIKDELNENAAFVAGIFYLYAPYHLVDMHFRVTMGETIAWAYLPIALLFTKKAFENTKAAWFVFLGFTIALLILTHQVIALSFFPLLILYGIFCWYRTGGSKKNKNIIRFALGIILGLGLTCFYWLPILFESQFTHIGIYKTPVSFPTISGLIYTKWRFGFLFQGPRGELSYLLGYTQLFVIAVFIYMYAHGKFKGKLFPFATFFLVIFSVAVFFIQPFSKPIWDIIPKSNFFQFSTRLLIVANLAICVLAALVIAKINKNSFLIILCLAAVAFTILNWGNRRVIPQINDTALITSYLVSPDNFALEPSAPKWASRDKKGFKTKPKMPVDILIGNARIKPIFRSSTRHEYLITSIAQTQFKENTLYFPGWNLYVNNKPHQINFESKNYPGIITFKLDKGTYKVELKFENTWDRSVAAQISFATLISIILFIISKPLANFFKRI